jgi:hypothetical protein
MLAQGGAVHRGKVARTVLVLSVVAMWLVIAACGNPRTIRSGENEMTYTSAILEEEANEIADLIFSDEVDLGNDFDTSLDKNGVLLPTGSGARRWNFTYTIKVFVEGDVLDNSKIEDELTELAGSISEQVLGPETREYRRIVELFHCSKKFDDCKFIFKTYVPRVR